MQNDYEFVRTDNDWTAEQVARTIETNDAPYLRYAMVILGHWNGEWVIGPVRTATLAAGRGIRA